MIVNFGKFSQLWFSKLPLTRFSNIFCDNYYWSEDREENIPDKQREKLISEKKIPFRNSDFVVKLEISFKIENYENAERK